MVKAIIKKLLVICFRAIINELVIEYKTRKEVSIETSEAKKESIKEDVQRHG